MSDNLVNAYRNLDKLQEQSKPEWRPTTDTQKIVETSLSIDNIGSFLTNALPKINPQVAQKVATPLVPEGMVPVTENGAPIMPGVIPMPAVVSPPIVEKAVEFESDGIQFKVAGGVVYKKMWIEVNGNPDYKIEDGKIFHLEWQKIKD